MAEPPVRPRPPTRTGSPAEAPARVAKRLARRQHWSVTRSQLIAAGVSRHAIDWRVQRGEWQRVYKGVYVVGPDALEPRTCAAAALLACGSGSFISHELAAYFWVPGPKPTQIDVTVVGRRCRARDGIRVHRVSRIDAHDIRYLDGIALTAPARTLIDLAAGGDAARVEQALAEAYGRKVLRAEDLQAAIERAGGRPGVAMLRALVAAREAGFTRSEAERRLRQLLRDARLPQPRVNARLLRYEVDFLWPEERVVLEVDGYAFHGNRAAFERDRQRDMTLVAAGYRVIRVTWRQIRDEPLSVVAAVAGALAMGR